VEALEQKEGARLEEREEEKGTEEVDSRDPCPTV
jgi:hypothetical protein